MSHFFKESQEQAANIIASGALKLDNRDARRVILEQAKLCGAQLDEAISACLSVDDAQGLADVFQAWGPNARASRESVTRAAQNRAVDCLRTLMQTGHELSAKKPKPLLGFTEISVWASAAKAPNYGSNRLKAAELMTFLSSLPVQSHSEPWEAEAALALLSEEQGSFSLEMSDKRPEGALALARVRLAEALLRGGARLEPMPKAANEILKSSTLRVMALCLRGLAGAGEMRVAAEALAARIDWRGHNERSQALGGLLALLAEPMSAELHGFKGGAHVSAMAQARELERLTGDRAHAKPGMLRAVFEGQGVASRAFKMTDPGAELIMRMLGEDDLPISLDDFSWIIEASADGVEAFRQKIDKAGQAPREKPAFGQNMFALFRHVSRLGVSSGESARDQTLRESAPALLNELSNEHDAMIGRKDYESDASRLSAFAQKARLCVASLQASVAAPPTSAPRRSFSL